MKFSSRLLRSVAGRYADPGIDGARMGFNDHLVNPTVMDVFTPEDCERILRSAESIPGSKGKLEDKEYGEFRDSIIRWLFPNAECNWMFDKLETMVESVNQNYRLDLRGFFNGAQVSTYHEGGHYNWHLDLGVGNTSQRKLSISVQLSDPADYDGGELQFAALRGHSIVAPKSRGTAAVFPSYLVHSVAPVTRGVRHSLNCWVSGPPLR